MDIQIFRLDSAYDTADTLSTIVKNSAQQFSDNVVRLVMNMQQHWHGDDATLHINALVDEYDKFAKYFSNMTELSNCVNNFFVRCQQARFQMNNEGVNKIGTELHNTCSFTPIKKIEGTSGYYYDVRLKDDYHELEELCSFYENFNRQIENGSDELFRNWADGMDREKMHQYYQFFQREGKQLLNELKKIRDELAKVISNENQISF